MSRIVIVDDKWDFSSPIVQYALKAAKGTDTEIAGICLAADTGDETVGKAEAVLSGIKQSFMSEGVNFSSYVIGPDPDAFMKRIDGLMPASLVLVGDVSFSEEMVRGGVSVAALKEKLTCPVTTTEAIAGAHAEKKPAKGINWVKFLIYLIGSAIMYGVFYPYIETLNEKLFMAGTALGGLAIMVVVAVHAWIWGNTTNILPKLFKLEK